MGAAPSLEIWRTETTRILGVYSLGVRLIPHSTLNQTAKKWVRPIRVRPSPPTKHTVGGSERRPWAVGAVAGSRVKKDLRAAVRRHLPPLLLEYFAPPRSNWRGMGVLGLPAFSDPFGLGVVLVPQAPTPNVEGPLSHPLEPATVERGGEWSDAVFDGDSAGLLMLRRPLWRRRGRGTAGSPC